jgi:glycosyltransferase involved in cell wall biosynthesis
MGIVYSRNRGIEIIEGTYYAPFDADDIAHPRKLEIQLAFMEKNPDFGMVGCRCYHTDEKLNNLKSKFRLPGTPESIPVKLLFRAYFVHISVAVRKEALPSGGYTSGSKLKHIFNFLLLIHRKNLELGLFSDKLLRKELLNRAIKACYVAETNAFSKIFIVSKCIPLMLFKKSDVPYS